MILNLATLALLGSRSPPYGCRIVAQDAPLYTPRATPRAEPA